ncbi:MAG TPA: protein translocase subunit SecF [Longilinea sp.]|nr:protein translocase subunit SecF [Longilinea sp.]
MNIMSKRYYFFAFSLVLIIAGVIVFATNGLPLAIDFKGGTLLEMTFNGSKMPTTTEVIQIYAEHDANDPQVQFSGNMVLVRSDTLDTPTQDAIVSEMNTKYGDVTLQLSGTVTPSISQEVTRSAMIAVLVATLGIILYMTYAFRKLTHVIRYSIVTIVAMLHDIFIVLSLAAIGGKFFGWQVDSMFLTAVLTVIGFSVQDTIVVFDRIRENSAFLRRIPYEQLVNHSIVQTLQRSLNTTLMTFEFILLALALFGGITLREFSIILLVGLLSGAYSSICIAAPLLIVWENKEWKTWFKHSDTSEVVSQ